MRTYNEIRNNIKTLLLLKCEGNNEEKKKQNSERVKGFIEAVTELKNSYGLNISLTWLRDLLNDSNLTWREKKAKIERVIKQANIKTETKNYYFHEWHRYGNGEVKNIRTVKGITFLKV